MILKNEVIIININDIFESKNCGKFIILDKSDKYGYYKVKFLETGYESEFRKDAILKGEILDRYKKTNCGVAYVGNVSTKNENSKIYSLWNNMISRCYNPKNKRYKAYGGRGVRVSDSWLCFENFVSDITKIDGYDEYKFNNELIVLDKDIKQINEVNKIYSLETCKFIDKSINDKIQPSQQKRFIAVDTEGNVYHDFNITDFSKKHNLDRRGISSCLNGRNKTHKGWKFRYE